MARPKIFTLLAVLVLSTSLAAPASRAAVDPTPLAGCDPLDATVCLFPFPNDLYTVPAATPTGLRVALLPTAMPRNVAGKPIDPTEWNRNDGWSPGSLILTYVQDLDLDATGAPSIKDPRTAQLPDSPVVVLNTRTGQPHPVWAELDAQAPDDANRALLIRPATNFDEATRYIVALRNLKDAAGQPLEASSYFKVFRDGTDSLDPLVNARRSKMEGIFRTLGRAGVDRSSLYLAWDFTVASEQNLSERILHMRDETFAALGDHDLADLEVAGKAPTFVTQNVTNFTPEQDGRWARRIAGVMTVPNYLSTPNAAPGGRFVYGPNGLPTKTGESVVQYTCNIPRKVLSSGTDPNATVTPGKPSLYGHGLLGSHSEANGGAISSFANEHGYVFCATDWAGMSTVDLGNVAHSIADMSNFSTMADRMQQGFLNFMVLGRLMIHPDGFSADPAFQGPGGAPTIDTRALFYDGNSQGGIMGGALVAVSPDIRRGVLGVPAMNYSTLLDRSVDWDAYYMFFSLTYPNRLDQQTVFSLMQMLWDRGEANGYAHHMTDDPYRNTPEHQVLLHIALGDHQVANIAAEVETRTIGAAVYRPVADAAKIPEGVVPFAGVPNATEGYTGSVAVLWDSGNEWPRLDNVAPTEGRDPHGRPRNNATARVQKARFLQIDGYFSDVCGGAPCLAPF